MLLNGAYNPSIKKQRFLQPNKNLIPLIVCTTQSREQRLQIITIHIYSNEQITINHNYKHRIDIHLIEQIKTSHSCILLGHGMNKTTLQNRVSTPQNKSNMLEPTLGL